jgi:ABC-type nitrate/sulfonate/bicarbonate transport system substrate-binding protein
MRHLLIILILLLIVGGCQNQDDTSRAHTEVRVGITKSFLGEGATFVAQEQGYFKDYGLNVQFEENTSGSKSIRELFQGTVDIAHVAETPVVYSLVDSSYYKGKQVPSFQIFADMIYADEIQHIVGRKEADIESPEDIAGKKVGVYQDTQLDYFLDSFLLEYQVPKRSLTLLDITPVEQLTAITNGEIDVAVTWEPYATYIKQKLEAKAVFLDTKLTYSTLWLAVTLDSYGNKNSEVLINYLKAIRKAQTYIEENPRSAQELLAKRTGVPIEAVRATWENLDFELSLSERMITLLDDQSRWMARNNLADTSGFDFRSLINFEPMRTVYPEGVTVIQ